MTKIGQTLSPLEMRCQEVTLRRVSLEEQMSDRYRDVVLAGVIHEYHLRPLFSPNEERVRPSRVVSSSVWARSI